MSRRNTGQSIVEYAILLGVVIAALLIMQMFMKRSISGNLKESADKIGEQFSASGTTIKQKRTMSSDQNIVEGVATDTTINTFKPSTLQENAKDALGSDVYSYSERSGGKSTMTTQSKTDSAAAEKTRADDFSTDEVTDFTSPVTE